MTDSEKMIERARQKEREREGVRMKARIPDRLWRKVKRCAEAACMASEDWTCLACRAWQSGRFNGVAFDETLLLGTREDSSAQWVRTPHGFEAQDLRTALAAAVTFHEPKIRPVTPQVGTQGWVRGRDYLVKEA